MRFKSLSKRIPSFVKEALKQIHALTSNNPKGSYEVKLTPPKQEAQRFFYTVTSIERHRRELTITTKTGAFVASYCYISMDDFRKEQSEAKAYEASEKQRKLKRYGYCS